MVVWPAANAPLASLVTASLLKELLLLLLLLSSAHGQAVQSDEPGMATGKGSTSYLRATLLTRNELCFPCIRATDVRV